jgi:hypothetical protein
MTALSPDEPLMVGDLIELGGVLKQPATFKIIQVIGNVYKTNATSLNKPVYIRRATHKAGVENGIFVFVAKDPDTGRWKRTDFGTPAEEWGSNPMRPAPPASV